MSGDPFGFGDEPPASSPTPPATAGRRAFGAALTRPFAGRTKGATPGSARLAPAGTPPSWSTGWSGSPRAAVRPPAAWLVTALVVAVAAALVALTLGRTVGVAAVCWLVAGPVAIGLVAIFVLRDTRAAAEPIYLRPRWIRPLWVVTILGVIVGIAASAWRIADWWGRL